MKSLLKSVAILTIFSIITRGLGFIIKIIDSRVLTNEVLGIYSIVSSIFAVVLTIVASGTPLVISKMISKDYKNDHYLTTSGMIIGLVLSIIASIFIILLKPLFGNYHTVYYLLLILIPAIVSTGIYTGIHGYFWGHENYAIMSIIELIEQIVRITCILILFYLIPNLDQTIVPAISISVACIVSTIIGISIYLKNNGHIKISNKFYKEIIKSSTPIMLVHTGNTILYPIINFILPYQLTLLGYSNTQSLGLLGVLNGMTLPLLSIPSSIIGSLAMALIPRISKVYTTNKNNSVVSHIQHSLNFTICCCFIVIPIFISMGIPICEILFNNTTAGVYLKNSAILLIPQGIAMMSMSLLNSLSEEKTVFRNSIIGSIILLSSIFVFTKKYNIYSLIIGMIISFITISLLNFIKLQKLFNNKLKIINTLLPCIITSICVIILNSFIQPIINLIWGKFMSVLLCSIIDFIMFILLLMVFKVVDINYYKNKIFNNSIKKMKQ